MRLISVIIACYNVADYLDVCINSLVNQTIGLKNIQIILVDDASTDDGKTVGILEKYEQQYSDDIVLIKNDINCGAGGCRNKALEYVDSEYITYCDADDWLDLDAYEVLYKVAKEQDADLLEFDYTEINEHSGISKNNGDVYPGNLYVIDNRSDFILPSESKMICMNKLYRSTLLTENKIMFLENAVYEEAPFSLLIRYYVHRYYKLDMELYYYYQHGDSYSKKYYERFSDVLISYDMLLNEIKKRGFYEAYTEETDFTYYCGRFYIPLLNLASRGQFCSVEMFGEMQSMIRNNIDDIRKNRFFNEYFGNVKVLGDIIYVKIGENEINDVFDLFRALNNN